jgi:hypothetical protein
MPFDATEWISSDAGHVGSASLCSDGRRTYVLLFNGSDREMRAYMAKMGIDTQSLKKH